MPGTYIKLPPDVGGGSSFITSVTTSTSIALTVVSNNLTAALRLSSDAATAGSLKVTNTVHANGLHSEIPFATALATGALTNADWTTFNSKENAIAAGTTAQYWRGDKTFQTLDTGVVPENGNLYYTDARARLALSATAPVTYDNTTGVFSLGALTLDDLVPETSGTPAGVGKIGQILTASQVANTSTGVGATGVYGNATSLSITAGRWQVWGSAGFSENAAVLTTGLQCGISASSAGGSLNEFDTALFPGLISGSSDLILSTPSVIIDIASTTTYYLNTKFYYTSGSPQHRGKITALRIG